MKTLLLSIFSFSPLLLGAQTFLFPTDRDTSIITTCSGTVYDSGGELDSPADYDDGIITIYPSNPGEMVVVSFVNVEFGPNDYLKLYNGDSLTSDYHEDYLGDYRETYFPDQVYASNPDGSLTMRFDMGYQTEGEFEATIGCVATLPIADLNLHAQEVYPYFTPGEGISLNLDITNQGGEDVIDQSFKVYLSKDETVSLDDSLIFNGLDIDYTAGQSYKQVMFFMPIGGSDMPLGDYYLITWLDATETLVELDETNNVVTTPFTVMERNNDYLLTYSSGISSGSYGVGSNVSFYYNVENLGLTDAPGTTTKFYLSSDQVVDGSDVFLGVDNVYTMSGGEESLESFNFDIPSGLSSGDYYVIAVVDEGNAVSETNESNNTFTKFINILTPTVTEGFVLFPTSGSQTITTCDTIIFDDGGEIGNYSNYNYGSLLSILPSDPTKNIELTFTSFELEYYYDYLNVYEGETTDDLIASYTDDDLPPVIIASNNSLTLYFRSDGSSNFSGFEIQVSCTAPLAVNEELSSKVFMYPNPTETGITIDAEGLGLYGTSIEVSDVNQKVVLISVIEGLTTLDLSSIDAGVYFLKITQGDTIVIKKIVKL